MKPIGSSLAFAAVASYKGGSFFFSGFFFLTKIYSIAFLYTLFETAPSGISSYATETSSYGGGATGCATTDSYYIATGFGDFLVALFKAASILALALAIVYLLLRAFLIFSAFSLFSFSFLTIAITSAFFFSSD